MEIASHGISTPNGMIDFVELVHQAMVARAHGHVVCPLMQFPERYKKMESLHEESLNFEAEYDNERTMS